MKKIKQLKLSTKILITVLIIFSAILAYGVYYVNDYYRVQTTQEVTNATKNGVINDDYIEFNKNSKSNVGIIFYPGGKVDSQAYNVMLNKLAQKGYHVFGLKVLFNLAILDQSKAQKVIDNNKQIKKWVIMGHSLGGVSGQNFANGHKNLISAVIHLGSYPLDSKNNVPNLAIYGSLDKVVKKEKLGAADELFQIMGGNHAQYGNYGKQAGDGDATITSQNQQDQTVNKVIEFLNKKGVK